MGETVKTINTIDSVIEGLKGSFGVIVHPEGHRTGRPMVCLYEHDSSTLTKLVEANAKVHDIAVRYIGKDDEIEAEVYFVKAYDHYFRIEENDHETKVDVLPNQSYKPY